MRSVGRPAVGFGAGSRRVLVLWVALEHLSGVCPREQVARGRGMGHSRQLPPVAPEYQHDGFRLQLPLTNVTLVSEHPLVIGAGLGTTGTKFLSYLLAEITKGNVTHFDDLLGVDLASMRGARRPGRCVYEKCTRSTKRGQATISQVKFASFAAPVPKRITRRDFPPPELAAACGTLESLWDLRRENVADFDFTPLRDLTGVFDAPIPNLFPFIYRAFPNAKVILTVRNSTDWVVRRWTRWFHKHDPLPFAEAVTGHDFADFVGHMTKAFYPIWRGSAQTSAKSLSVRVKPGVRRQGELHHANAVGNEPETTHPGRPFSGAALVDALTSRCVAAHDSTLGSNSSAEDMRPDERKQMAQRVKKRCEAGLPKGLLALESLFIAHNAMVRSLVPPDKLLIVNVFREPQNQVARRIAEFLELPESSHTHLLV